MFLDEVATALVDLDPLPAGSGGTDGMGGRTFGGGWSECAAARASARARWEATYATQQDELKRLRSAAAVSASAISHNRGPTDNDKFIHAFKGQNVDRALARRRRDAAQRLAEAEDAQVRKPPPRLALSVDLTSSARVGAALHVRDLVVGDRLRLTSLDLTSGEHLLVTGANGAGKSTLLGVLSGRIVPTSGEVSVRARAVAELTQDPEFSDPKKTAVQLYLEGAGESAPELRSLGLLHPRDLHRPVGVLSVGQRRRLALAIVVATGPDLLLLDEPTNHISLALAGELEEAIGRTAGTVVVASHDRWLRRAWQGAELNLGG